MSSSLEGVNTCQDDQELDILAGKVALLSDERNCTVDQRTWIAQVIYRAINSFFCPID